MSDFLNGATMLAALGISLFFVRYWRSTGDRLFAVFSAAFGIFALNRVLLSMLEEDNEARTWVYLLRAATFALIALAVLDKNYGRQRR